MRRPPAPHPPAGAGPSLFPPARGEAISPHAPSPRSRGEGWGEGLYRKAMDTLYRLCAIVAGGALVLISAVIPWAVFTRYALNSAASWPEPMAILLTIVLTFFGSAACYRAGTHMSVSVLVRALSPPVRRVIEPFSEGLVALVGFSWCSGVHDWWPRPGTSRSRNFLHCRSGSLTFRSRSAAPSRCSSSPSAC
jgi:Tripartite ATP-independent periplasmic transporters, DctQ component